MDTVLITTRTPLLFGLVAVVVAEESDRTPYVPAPVAADDHHPRCGCAACVARRAVGR